MSADGQDKTPFTLPPNRHFMPVKKLIQLKIIVAAILLRVSSTGQVRKSGDYGSLEKQEEATRRYIKSEGWNYCAKYVDAAEQGDDENRPGLTAMEAAAARGEFNRLVVTRQSRLGRGITIIRRVVGRLEALGVEIYDTNGQRITVKSGRACDIERTLAQAYDDEKELIKIRNGASSDRLATAQSGKWRGGCPPIGYMLRENQRSPVLLLDPKYSVYIIEIFRRTVARQTKRQVVDWLRAEGVRTPPRITNGRDRGSRPFMEKHIIGIIRNPVYMGCVSVSHYSDYNGEGEAPLGLSAKDVAVFGGNHERTVTPAIWIDANDELDGRRKSRKQRSGGDPENNFVQGLISCGCGCEEKKTPSSQQYVAMSANHSHGVPCRCKLTRISIPIVDDCVLTLLERAANTPELQEELMNEFRAQQCRKRKGKRLQQILAEETKLKGEITNVTNTLYRCATEEARHCAASALDRSADELRKIVAERKNEELLLLSDGGKSVVSESDFLAKLRKLKDAMKGASRSEQKSLVQQCIASVTVRPLTVGERRPKVIEIVVQLDPLQFRCGASALAPISAQVRLDSRKSYSVIEPFLETRTLVPLEAASPKFEADVASNHPLDKLTQYKATLAAAPGMTKTLLAARINKTKGHVSQILGLERIDPETRERISAHKHRFTLRDLLRVVKLPPSRAAAEVDFLIGHRQPPAAA